MFPRLAEFYQHDAVLAVTGGVCNRFALVADRRNVDSAPADTSDPSL